SRNSLVSVQLFGESGCPDTTAFIAGPLADAEKAPGVADIMRLDWTPFGNAYFLTAECGGVPAPAGCGTSTSCLYNSTVRECFLAHCGLGGRPFADCYSPGHVRCQHGSVECAANQLEACAKMKDAESYWPISRCIEMAFFTGKLRTGSSSPEEVHDVAASCGLAAETFDFCASQGHEAVVAMAKSTPPHPGVPYVLVNGVALSETKDLLKKICEAYEGDKPAGCLEHRKAAKAAVAQTPVDDAVQSGGKVSTSESNRSAALQALAGKPQVQPEDAKQIQLVNAGHEVRFATGRSLLNRDQLFDKNALAKAAMQCIEMGANLDGVDLHSQIPLLWAAAPGNMVIVKFLLNPDFEVNVRDKARKTALFFAIDNGHLDVADYPVEMGFANPDFRLSLRRSTEPFRPGETAPCFSGARKEESEPIVGCKEEDNVLVEASGTDVADYLNGQPRWNVRSICCDPMKRKELRGHLATLHARPARAGVDELGLQGACIDLRPAGLWQQVLTAAMQAGKGSVPAVLSDLRVASEKDRPLAVCQRGIGFRDPYHPTGEAAWNKELERRGLKSEIREGKVFEELLRRQGDAKMDVAENMFTEAILDNVVDLGELVLQFYALYVDRQPVNGDADNSKVPRRLRKRMNKDYGLDASFDMKDELIASKDKPSAQAIQDFAGSLSAMQTLSPRFKFKRN
ncbi:IFI30, partial [Symbiodinium sp. CCMP2456]